MNRRNAMRKVVIHTHDVTIELWSDVPPPSSRRRPPPALRVIETTGEEVRRDRLSVVEERRTA